MPAKILFKKRVYEIPDGLTILSVLQSLEISPESVIPIREGVMLPEDEILQDGDVIKLATVISGG